ncbi:MAG: hypothetical protein DMG53_22340 [Acidobacteria bacterium]|nr:MAG: hypothetical protein DMG53_22340 [Acidobacteriota bacterium]
MLSPVATFEVSEAGYPRKAPDFGRREPQKHCRPVLCYSLLAIHAHLYPIRVCWSMRLSKLPVI